MQVLSCVVEPGPDHLVPVKDALSGRRRLPKQLRYASFAARVKRRLKGEPEDFEDDEEIDFEL